LAHAFGALTYDPQIKGGLIVLIAVVILPGSVYMVLGTDLGARLGFLVAAAGLMGWMAVMGLVWTVYGIGLKGDPAVWKGQGLRQGQVAGSKSGPLAGFPNGWKALKLDNPEAADAQAVADEELAPAPGSGKKGPYASSGDYVTVGAYERGGEKYLFTLKHRPHWLLLQVQRAIKQPAPPGQPPPKPQADPTQPVTSVLLIRDLGSLRVPASRVMLGSLLLFGLLVYSLHRRDRIAMAARQATA
jgi:hypothetical protein